MGRVKVKAEALIRVNVGSLRLAEALNSAVSPDNKPTPEGLKVETWREGRKLYGRIVCSRGVDTFTMTLDDLLSSLQTAWKALEVAEGGQKG